MAEINKKRIIQLSLGLGYSGSAKFAILSSVGFRKQGHEIIFIASEGSLTERRAREAGLTVEILPGTKDYALNLQVLRRVFEAFRPEFAIAHDSKERKYLMRFRRQEGRRFYCIAFRSIVPSSFPLISSIPYNLWLDLSVACSKGVARSLMYRGILPSKIRVVYNGIEAQEEAPTPIPRETLGIPQHSKIIGMSTMFHKTRKGFDILFSAVSKGLPFPFRLLMLGITPRDRPYVERIARSYDVSEDVLVFPGYVDDVWPYYAAMDVFALPSRKEGFSLSLLEAMASGLPVIASDIAGNNEAITHNTNGLLFPLRDTDELRRGILRLIEQPGFALQLGKAARRTVLENFTYDKVAIRFDQVLDELRSSRTLDPWE